MASVNRVKELWAAKRPAFGVWCGIPGAAGIEVTSTGASLDFVVIDRQHGLISDEAMVEMIRACEAVGATPFVRVPQNEPWMIMAALDAGALGVIIPLVNDAADARRAVSACRFPPDGTRSYGPIRAERRLGTDPKPLVSEVSCIVQIETKEGLENADDICSTPGLDGVYIGPADLAITMGIPLHEAANNDTHANAIEHIRQTCERNGIASGVHTTSGEAAKKAAERGFTMINAGVDYVMIPAAARREMETARSGART